MICHKFSTNVKKIHAIPPTNSFHIHIHTDSISAWGNQSLDFDYRNPNSVFKMESACEVNPTPNKDNYESQSLKNQGNIHGGWFFLFHQSSKPESTITSKNIKFERIESQDYSGRCSKIITRDGMWKVALSTFLIWLIISLSIFLIMKHVTKNHDPTKESNAENQINIEYNDDHFIIQAIKQRKENGPCTFLIPGEIVKKYKISSWELNDGKDDPKCHEYNLNFGHDAPHHQYIHLKPSNCGSICDNNTLKNTIHLKVKYDKFNERSISFPISCKTRGKTKDGREYIKYEFLTTCDSGEGISSLITGGNF